MAVSNLDDAEREELADWCSELDTDCKIESLEPRTTRRVGGVVQRIRLVPQGETTALEVDIADETGEVSAVWLGRQRIRGVDLGRLLVVEGMLSDGPDGLRMINPSYEIVGPS